MIGINGSMVGKNHNDRYKW